MAPPLSRTWFNTLIDDDGSGTLGTVWNKTQVDGLLDTVDASLAGVADIGGVAAGSQLAYFIDSDTLQGQSQLTIPGVGQLRWPTSPTPSSDVTTLDDYREGTWTPVLGGTGGESGQTYSNQNGQYQKVGRWVTVRFWVVLTNKGTISGDTVIKGLPFALDAGGNNYTAVSLVWSALAVAAVLVQGYVVPGSTTISVQYATAAAVSSATPMPSSVIGNTSYLMGQFSYPAAS